MSPEGLTEAAAAALVGQWVLHLEHVIVGRVVRVHPPGEFQPEFSKPFVEAWVIELEQGHSLVWGADLFMPLTDRDAAFFEHVVTRLRELIGQVVNDGSTDGVPTPRGLLLLRAAFLQQIAALTS